MKNLIRIALTVLGLATITPVANAAVFHDGSTVTGDAAATQMQQQGQL
jgi:hypothetical protein